MTRPPTRMLNRRPTSTGRNPQCGHSDDPRVGPIKAPVAFPRFEPEANSLRQLKAVSRHSRHGKKQLASQSLEVPMHRASLSHRGHWVRD